MKKSMVALLMGLLVLGVVVLPMGDVRQVEVFAQEDNNLPDSRLLVDVTECESTESSATSDVTLEKLQQQKEDVAVGKYNDLLAQWAYDEEFVDDVNADFPEFYGGMYLDDDKNLVIQVTSLTDEVVNYFGEIIDLTDVEFEEVSYSFEELKEVHDDLENNMYSGEGYSWAEDISAVGVSLLDNCVTLYLVYPEQESYLVVHEQEKYIKGIESDINDSFNSDMIQVIANEMHDNTSATSVYDVRLGTQMTSGGTSRSAGFWAYDSDGNKGIVTAGHNTSKGDVYTIVNTTFGTAGSPYIKGGVDAVFVKCTSSFFGLSRYFYDGSIRIKSNTNAYLPVGATSYSYGFKSGYKSGTVLDCLYSTTMDGLAYPNMTLTDATCIAGDSGGIVAGSGTSSERLLVGIITGRQGTTGYQIFSKSNYIIAQLKVTVY